MNIPHIPNLIYYAIPIFIILILVEIIISTKMRLKAYQFKDAVTSISMGLGNVAINIIAKGLIFGALIYIYQFRIFTLPFSWWTWLLLIFADDFSYYWFHRISHENRFFWASHIIHHSSQHYNLSTALRQTWTGSFTSFIFWLWLPLIGFHPVMILTQMSISLLYQFGINYLEHLNQKLKNPFMVLPKILKVLTLFMLLLMNGIYF